MKTGNEKLKCYAEACPNIPNSESAELQMRFEEKSNEKWNEKRRSWSVFYGNEMGQNVHIQLSLV